MPTVPHVAVIPGDGIGPEVTTVAVEVADAALARMGGAVEWATLPWGSDHWLATGRMMPEDGLELLAQHDAILLGAVGDPRIPDHVTLHGLLLPIRQRFDLYLGVRPVRLFEGVSSALVRPGVIDLVIYRENTEGEYADVGGRVHQGTDLETAVQGNVFTRRGCRRVMEAAFRAARERRGHVTSVTKSNAQAHGMVLWDEVFESVAAAYPGVATRTLLVDAAAFELVRRPDRFDVLVASNLFGDVLSDLAAGVAGGLGLVPSGNINPDRNVPSMFEPVHGSAPDIAGRGIANPIGAVLSAAMALEHLALADAARAIWSAVARVLGPGGPRTPDLGGTHGTRDLAQELIAAID